jgi:DNA repair exonuclease SbcCD ATPase subunit
MQNDRAAPILMPRKDLHDKRSGLIALPATPSFSLGEANSIVEIEVQADELLGYINKLTSLADRACSTAIRQSQTAHLIEESRHGEINDLRKKLDQQNEKIHEQQIAIIRLQEESKAQIAALEVQLRQSNIQRHEEPEIAALRRENARLAKRLNDAEDLAATKRRLDSRDTAAAGSETQKVVEIRTPLARQDQTTSAKNNSTKPIELELRAKILELEQHLSESRAQCEQHEQQLKHKDAIIQATAIKEAEMGNLIKRLSAECAALSEELQKTNPAKERNIAKAMESANEGTIWRRVIARLQEDS